MLVPAGAAFSPTLSVGHIAVKSARQGEVQPSRQGSVYTPQRASRTERSALLTCVALQAAVPCWHIPCLPSAVRHAEPLSWAQFASASQLQHWASPKPQYWAHARDGLPEPALHSGSVAAGELGTTGAWVAGAVVPGPTGGWVVAAGEPGTTGGWVVGVGELWPTYDKHKESEQELAVSWPALSQCRGGLATARPQQRPLGWQGSPLPAKWLQQQVEGWRRRPAARMCEPTAFRHSCLVAQWTTWGVNQGRTRAGILPAAPHPLQSLPAHLAHGGAGATAPRRAARADAALAGGGHLAEVGSAAAPAAVLAKLPQRRAAAAILAALLQAAGHTSRRWRGAHPPSQLPRLAAARNSQTQGLPLCNRLLTTHAPSKQTPVLLARV